MTCTERLSFIHSLHTDHNHDHKDLFFKPRPHEAADIVQSIFDCDLHSPTSRLELAIQLNVVLSFGTGLSIHNVADTGHVTML